MTEALSALFYLELRSWINRLRTLTSDPKRLVPWIIFIVWLATTQAGQIIFLISGRSSPRASTFFYRDFVSIVLGAVPGLYLALLGVVIGASKSAPADFSSPADARYLAGSPLSQRTVVLWLQLRKLINPRLVVGLFMGTAILGLYTVPLGSALVLQLTVIAAIVAAFGLQLPLFLARRKLPAVPWTALTWMVVVAGLATAVIGVAQAIGFRGFPPGWHELVVLPPGSVVAAGIAGDLRAMAAEIVLAALSISLTVYVAGDSYPELWEASRRRFTLVRVMRRGFLSPIEARRAMREARGEPDTRPARKAPSVSGSHVPPGPLTLVWKEWVTLRRRRGGLGLQAVLLAISLVAGTVAGFMLQGGSGGAGALVGAVVFPTVILSAYFRVSLASDLRNPLWWLSPAGLAQRLAAWALAGMLPYYVIIGAGVATALLISEPALAIPVLVALLAFMWTMRMIGLAVYAVMPSSLDMMGPGVAIRVIAVYLLSAPVFLAGLGTGLLAQSLAIGLVGATVVAVAESIGLLVFAAYRIEGNGLGFARAETR